MLTVQERKRWVLRMFVFLLRDLLVITALVGLVAWMQERDRPSSVCPTTAASAND